MGSRGDGFQLQPRHHRPVLAREHRGRNSPLTAAGRGGGSCRPHRQ